MEPVMAQPQISKEERANSDAYSLVRAEESRIEAQEIRKDPKRFAAAVAQIKKENKERKEAMKKEMAARSKAVQ